MENLLVGITNKAENPLDFNKDRHPTSCRLGPRLFRSSHVSGVIRWRVSYPWPIHRTWNLVGRRIRGGTCRGHSRGLSPRDEDVVGPRPPG